MRDAGHRWRMLRNERSEQEATERTEMNFDKNSVYPVPRNAPDVSEGINVPKISEGQRVKATDVSPWYGVSSVRSCSRY